MEKPKSTTDGETAANASPDPDGSSSTTVDSDALRDHYEKWATETEVWARSLEAQLQQSQAELNTARRELTRVKHSFSWRLTAPFRGLATMTRTVASSTLRPGRNAAVRAGLDAGLALLRRHDGLRNAARTVLRRIPGIGSKLEAYAGSRAEERSGW
jgi:hypothetical protein